MKNLHLKTFISVAEAGSFNKAAENIYLSSAAIIKQINLLEAELGVHLFERTRRGLTLTKAGTSLYNDAKFITRYCREAVTRARNAMRESDHVIRVGTSPMTPAQLLTDLWPKIYRFCPDISFQLVPFENTPKDAEEILGNLGQKIDVVVNVFDETLLNSLKCAALEIRREPLCCAMSIHHPLAGKDRLTFQDLYGENLLLVRRKWSHCMDLVRDEILEDRHSINIVDFDYYDINIFNRCGQTRDLLLVIESAENIHPLLKVTPVEWKYTIPFGLLYPAQPSATIERFLSAVRTVI